MKSPWQKKRKTKQESLLDQGAKRCVRGIETSRIKREKKTKTECILQDS